MGYPLGVRRHLRKPGTQEGECNEGQVQGAEEGLDSLKRLPEKVHEYICAMPVGVREHLFRLLSKLEAAGGDDAGEVEPQHGAAKGASVMPGAEDGSKMALAHQEELRHEKSIRSQERAAADANRRKLEAQVAQQGIDVPRADARTLRLVAIHRLSG